MISSQALQGLSARQHRGRTAYYAGVTAEESVARIYSSRGYKVLETRWRGAAGEIDLILHGPDGLVFTEVKKSRSFADAAILLTPRQCRRILAAAEEFLAARPECIGVDCRVDVALVDAVGAVKIIENASFDF